MRANYHHRPQKLRAPLWPKQTQRIRYGSETDIPRCPRHVRFAPIADIQPAWISPPESQRQLDEERPAESTT